jgi:predicted nucleotidyltransferase
LFSQSESELRIPESTQRESELFPDVVKRCYDRALTLQRVFGKIIAESSIELPQEGCICLSGSVSRLECVKDSDIDYVLIWNDLENSAEHRKNSKAKAIRTIRDINRDLSKNALRPCDSFSAHKPLSELIRTENLFSRYSIISLVDSSPVIGSESSYEDHLKIIRSHLSEYAIGISAEHQVMRALSWYVQREGWMDQLHYGTSINRFSRLIQLFTTILSINEFGIESTRQTKTTWIRIERLEPYLPNDMANCLKKLWIKALELKEKRDVAPMLSDSGFIGISQVVEMWNYIQSLSRPPVA